ncbi:alpha/beta fold hydrolase [Tessaracoccus oleiagri]|uniref:Pimeloyl-ACP methyl ester carboxylesterase n=1 Tax=Tessaracoccus oleiagri TaxID=686624 RepID=A0A1G9KK53_9ACTN|nr:alpha/beta hydrolase [Tessaracoccus oleiagri]SDL50032.1 Pimeloyl-ACP methyl ester carboxylesterase [Tessaracoccus oleiagri]
MQELEGFDRSTRRVRDLEVAVLDSRPDASPSTPVFVLVHGLGVSSLYFRPFAQRLAERARVVALDLPGFGHTDAPDRALRIPGFAHSVVDVVSQLGLEAPILVGHSMGCQVVVEALALEPQLARAAVLMGPVVRPEDRRPVTVVRRFLKAASAETPASAWLSVAAFLRCGPRWFVEIFPAMTDYRIEERIGDVSVPVTLVAGERDALAPAGWLELLRERAGGPATSHVVPGAAHQVMVSHADEAVRLCTTAGARP